MENLLTDLNTFLSDLCVFYRKLQNYHWNIVGRNFFVIHEKLETYYNQINEQIDEVAEHILMIGGQPLGTLQDYLKTSKITEATNEKVGETIVFKNLQQDYETLLQDAIKIKKDADQKEEYKTSALMDELIDTYSKNIWMLKQSME